MPEMRIRPGTRLRPSALIQRSDTYNNSEPVSSSTRQFVYVPWEFRMCTNRVGVSSSCVMWLAVPDVVSGSLRSLEDVVVIWPSLVCIACVCMSVWWQLPHCCQLYFEVQFDDLWPGLRQLKQRDLCFTKEWRWSIDKPMNWGHLDSWCPSVLQFTHFVSAEVTMALLDFLLLPPCLGTGSLWHSSNSSHRASRNLKNSSTLGEFKVRLVSTHLRRDSGSILFSNKWITQQSRSIWPMESNARMTSFAPSDLHLRNMDTSPLLVDGSSIKVSNRLWIIWRGRSYLLLRRSQALSYAVSEIGKWRTKLAASSTRNDFRFLYLAQMLLAMYSALKAGHSL